MSIEMIVFFVGIPALFAVLQYFLTRSGVSRRVKRSPSIAVSLTMLLCWLAMIGGFPLPETYWFSKPDYVRFPDYFGVWLFCFPALFGLGVGAVIAKGTGPETRG